MSEHLRNIIAVALLVLMGAGTVFLVATAPSDADRVQSIGERIKCPVCQGESIANSPSEMARDMMGLIAERVEAGVDDDAIVDELLGSYSGAVLLDPPARGATLILWLAPLAAVAVGAAVIYWWRKHPTAEPDDDGPVTEQTRARRLTPLLALGGAFAVIVVVAGFFLQDREGPMAGVADLGGQDLEDVSDETMEAVIAANIDHPEVDGMRLALAERYYEDGEFSSAFPHYLAVAESTNATRPQVATALIRLGWMAWQGNGEAETALELLDQALEVDAGSTTARYLKAQVLWCGTGDTGRAEELLEEVLADPEVGEDVRDLVSADLAAVQSGETCS